MRGSRTRSSQQGRAGAVFTLGRGRRLTEQGVLRGAHVDVDPAALGIGLQAFVVIRLGHHSRDTVQQFHAHLRELPEVVASWYIGGIDDFLVHVAVRDTRHLQDLLMDAITTREEVARVRTEIVSSTPAGGVAGVRRSRDRRERSAVRFQRHGQLTRLPGDR